MRKSSYPALIAAGALVVGGCVSLEERPMTQGAIQKDQRLIVVVYSPPGPLIVELDNKGETAAKIIPGLGLVVKDAQDQRALKLSQDLQQYLPRWQAAPSFYPLFLEKVKAMGQPGAVVEPQDAGLPPDAWPKFNRAKDVLDWQLRYFIRQPDGVVSRNYSGYLQLDDALVLEVNVAPGLESDGEDNFSPNLKAVTRLLRVSSMRELWRHEDVVEDKAIVKTLYDYKVSPGDLVYAWQRMLPQLASMVVDNLAKNLQAAGVPLGPAQAPLLTPPPGPPPDVSSSSATAVVPPVGAARTDLASRRLQQLRRLEYLFHVMMRTSSLEDGDAQAASRRSTSSLASGTR